MKKSPIRILCQIYLLLALLVITALSPLPYTLLALALLIAMLYITFRFPHPRFVIIITVAVIFLLPTAIEPIIDYLTDTTPLPLILVQLIAAIAILPTIYLLDYYLRRHAETMTIVHGVKDRSTTFIFNTSLTVTISMLLVSLIVNNHVLLFTAAALLLYLLIVMIRLFYTMPGLSLDIPEVLKRVIAGTAAEISLHIKNRTSARVHCLVSPVDPWLEITPQRFSASDSEIQLDVRATPPLAGPARPQLWLSITDLLGFMQVNRTITPLELHVIPRARYAEWQARRYLEQTGGTGTATASPLAEAIPVRKKGIEYFDSRYYQPGDSLKDIDWKHTIKLNQIIVKEYIEAGRQASVMALNLSVKDAEEADKLAYKLITMGLIHAYESIPLALAIYDHEKVVLTTPVLEPKEVLVRTLSLVKDFTRIEFVQRVLKPPDISRLRRNITLLKQVESETAQRLLNMLNFEYGAMEQAVKNHPATLALSRISKQVKPPAAILLLSQLNHDAEALLVATDKLSRRGFTVLHIEEEFQQPKKYS